MSVFFVDQRLIRSAYIPKIHGILLPTCISILRSYFGFTTYIYFFNTNIKVNGLNFLAFDNFVLSFCCFVLKMHDLLLCSYPSLWVVCYKYEFWTSFLFELLILYYWILDLIFCTFHFLVTWREKLCCLYFCAI